MNPLAEVMKMFFHPAAVDRLVTMPPILIMRAGNLAKRNSLLVEWLAHKTCDAGVWGSELAGAICALPQSIIYNLYRFVRMPGINFNAKQDSIFRSTLVLQNNFVTLLTTAYM